MSYITNEDIEHRLGTAAYVQLTDDSGSGIADESQADTARQAAEGEANSHLARRFKVPIDLAAHPELGDVLKGIILDLVEHRLHARRAPVPAGITAKRQSAIDWLEGIAKGWMVLPATVAPEAAVAGGLSARAIGARRVLSRAEMEGL